MSPAAWQFAAAFGLVAAWVVVVGRSVLANWSRRRQSARAEGDAPMDGSGSFLGEAWYTRPRPVAAWRDQPLTSRRLQTMMACGFACLFSLLLAIAFGGDFTRLLISVVVLTVLYLLTAVVIGSIQLRQMEAEAVERRFGDGEGRRPARGRATGSVTRGGGVADEDQTPLIFEPLNFDEVLAEFGVRSVFDDLVDLDDNATGIDVAAESDQPESGPAVPGPTFSAAPEAGAKQASARARQHKRRRARPINLDADPLDAETGERKAGGDNRH